MKSFRVYTVIWALCFAVFSIAAFLIPLPTRFCGVFWVGYIFITVTFLFQLACSFFALKSNEPQKTVYSLPTFKASFTGLVAMLIAGGFAMVIPSFPMWLCILLCFAVLAATLIGVILTLVFSKTVSCIDKKVRTCSFVMRSLTADAEHVMASADEPEIKATAKKVYEAIRFSDVMSNAALEQLDTSIQRQFSAFEDAVSSKDTELSMALGEELLVLIDERNKRCRLLK
jgi:hypothetical protein